MTAEIQVQPGILTGLWNELRGKGVGGRSRVAEPDSENLGSRFLVTVGSEGEAEVLIGIEPTETAPEELSGRNVLVRRRTVGIQGRNQRVIALICRDRALEATFADVAVSVHGRIAAGQGSRRAVEKTLREFRRLLDRSTDKGIPLEAIVGMAGELMVLDRLTRIASSAWQTWNGPLGEIHDFRRAGRAIEVKASAHVGERTISINGLSQLEAPEGGLHLFHYVFVPDPEGEIAVSGLVRSIEEHADDVTGFRSRLAEADYRIDDEEAWDRFRLSLQGSSCYSVTDAFPKLTTSSLVEAGLPSGITSLSYSVALEAAESCRIAPNDDQRIFHEFMME